MGLLRVKVAIYPYDVVTIKSLTHTVYFYAMHGVSMLFRYVKMNEMYLEACVLNLFAYVMYIFKMVLPITL